MCILCRRTKAAASGDSEEKKRKFGTRFSALVESQVDMAAETKCSFEVCPHPPYSRGVAPSYLCLFPNLKTNLRNRNCRNNEVGIDAVSGDQGPVVQSVVSLTSSLRVISLTVLVDSIYNILIFFAEKM